MEDLNYMLGAMLRIPFQAIVDDIYDSLQKAGYFDLRPPHFIVFQQIRPNGVRATDIAQKAQITKQSMSYLINYLEKNEYIEKFDDPSDGRAQLIRLTKKGEDVENIARNSIANTQSEWRNVIGEAKINEIVSSLQLIVAHIESKP